LIVDTARMAARAAAERQAYLIEKFTERMNVLQQAPLTRSDGTTFQPTPSSISQ
jgi:hypothetical protein